MTDRDMAVIKGLECCLPMFSKDGHADCKNCPYVCKIIICNKHECQRQLITDALELLKAQEPRLITEDDFANADNYGYLPAWVENHCTSEMYFECIPIHAITDPDSKGEYRFWTSRPTNEQREAIPWQ